MPYFHHLPTQNLNIFQWNENSRHLYLQNYLLLWHESYNPHRTLLEEHDSDYTKSLTFWPNAKQPHTNYIAIHKEVGGSFEGCFSSTGKAV